MNNFKYFIFAAIIVFAAGCNSKQSSQGQAHDVVGGEETSDHGHEHEPGALSYTLFSDDYELFVEFPALIVGQSSAFAAHFTRLGTYKPVSEGKLTVSIGKELRNSVDAPSSPGIFRPVLEPNEAGIYQLQFELENKNGNATFRVEDVRVYSNVEEAAHDAVEEPAGNEITYLKEQAWKTEFQTMEVTPQPFYSVIHTSGKVASQPQSEITLNAQVAGTVQLLAVRGETVNRGDLLALISGSGVDNNMTLRLNESKIAFEKSKADYLRSMPLVKNSIISKKDFLDVEAQYQQDSLRYRQLAKLVSQNGLKITAPVSGFISKLDVENGQFIEAGSPLLTVTNKNQVLIESFVNQSDFNRVDGIFDANFQLPGDNKVVSLNEVDGKVKAKNAFVNESQPRIPVTFSATNNGMLMPGMFLEAFLFTGQKQAAIVVPLSSIIEEQGQYYVFVQSGGESFVKREVRLADNDGKNVEIQSGLEPGERIVTKGAYQIKLASMAGDLPIHGHTH